MASKPLSPEIAYDENHPSLPNEWVQELNKRYNLPTPLEQRNGDPFIPFQYMLRLRQGQYFAVLSMRPTARTEAPGPSPFNEQWKDTRVFNLPEEETEITLEQELARISSTEN